MQAGNRDARACSTSTDDCRRTGLAGSTVAAGTVEPRYTTNIGFRVLGRLIARPVNVGDLVEEGQILAAIDPTTLELAVQSARAELSRNKARLANASATEERKRTLIVSDSTTKASLDDAEYARAGAQASVARAQANLTKALEQLGHAQLKAEFAGVVTAVSADVGQVVSPGQTVVTVARPDVREAVVDVGPDFPVARVSPLLRVSSCARGRRLGQRFRFGSAGAQLWGLFGASRSKPLADG